MFAASVDAKLSRTTRKMVQEAGTSTVSILTFLFFYESPQNASDSVTTCRPQKSAVNQQMAKKVEVAKLSVAINEANEELSKLVTDQVLLIVLVLLLPFRLLPLQTNFCQNFIQAQEKKTFIEALEGQKARCDCVCV